MPDTRTRASGIASIGGIGSIGGSSGSSGMLGGIRLTGLLLAIALATSRLGLLAHELVGHGGTALACGGQISEVQLFWFAGGWIRYHFTTPPSVAAQLAISMGGIAVEVCAGSALWLGVRGDGLGLRLVRGIGTALVVHASWYLATGAWQGFGDGQLLHRVLGSARYPFAFGVGAVACTCGYFGARDIVGPLRATQATLASLVIAAGLAGGLHAGLAIGETHVRHDATYSTIMQPEHDRGVDRDLARWAAYQAAHGGPTSPAQRAREHARLEQVHRTFPFAWLLGAVLAMAIAIGAWRSLRHSEPARALSDRLLVCASASAAIAIAAVIAIDQFAR